MVKEEILKPSESLESTLPSGYNKLLKDIKERVQAARVRAALAVNKELVLLYYGIGRDILHRQKEQGWGAKVIERLATDLRRELPDMTGLSVRNLKYMRSFAEVWPDDPIVQQVAGQIPWFHNCILLNKLKDHSERLWYAQKASEFGWSRNVLVIQIETRLFERQGKATANFDHALPPLQSDLASELLKYPYNFEFLTMRQDPEEREIEAGLVSHIQKFLLELGGRFLYRPTLLSSQTALLRGDRTQNRQVQP